MTDHSTDIATRGETTLAIHDDQAAFTQAQIAALRLGEHATPADVAVFFHICKRSGLDPFSRQIYMIERKSGGYGDRPAEYTQTLQTGIDGFRVIGQRAAMRDGVGVGVDAPLWAGRDGNWRELWTEPGPPVAAKAVIWRDGNAFSHTAHFAEYAQTRKDRRTGEMVPMGLWGTMPANQLAKCAEAAAWRKAFPLDMSNLYVAEEMQQADNRAPAGSARSRASRATVTLDSVRTAPAPNPEPAGEDAQPGRMFAALDALFPKLPANTEPGARERLAYMSNVLGREVNHPRELDQADCDTVTEAAAAHNVTD